MKFPADRILGSLLAGAVGDALGSAYEGRSGPLVVDINNSGGITDDTQLTIATCEALLDRGTVDPEAIASRFTEWFRERRLTGLGSSTLKALRDLDAGAHWALAGARGEYAAGNGAAMRIAPLAFLLDPALDADRQMLRDVCRITHHNDEAYVGALAIVIALRYAAGHPPATMSVLCERVAVDLPDSAVRDRLETLARMEGRPVALAERFGASGYVVDSVPLAIYAAQMIARAPFREVLLDAIGAGGDTDTIGSICGQIAGANLGNKGLPRDLLDVLTVQAWVTGTAEHFATAFGLHAGPQSPAPSP